MNQYYIVTIGQNTANARPRFGDFLKEAFSYTCYVMDNTYAFRTNRSS
jgi:hypothetical protein